MDNDKLDEGLIYSGVSSEWQDAGNYTITIDTNSPGATVGGVVTPTYTTTIDNLIDDPIDLDNLTLTHIEFENKFPDWNRIQNMIEEYPTLRIALEKFESAYRMCLQDYKGKLKERGLDDEIRF